MNKSRKQYRIDEFLSKVPNAEYTEKVNAFCKHLGISGMTAWRYRNATWDAPQNMSIVRLIKAAEFFDVSVDQIINHPTNVPA